MFFGNQPIWVFRNDDVQIELIAPALVAEDTLFADRNADRSPHRQI